MSRVGTLTDDRGTDRLCLRLDQDVDLSGTLAMDGVVHAESGASLAELANGYGHRRSGLSSPDRTALTTDRARFMGDGVAAVAAESAYVTGDALERIDVTLPAT